MMIRKMLKAVWLIAVFWAVVTAPVVDIVALDTGGSVSSSAVYLLAGLCLFAGANLAYAWIRLSSLRYLYRLGGQAPPSAAPAPRSGNVVIKDFTDYEA
jgi:hypothetical protein